MNPDTTHAEPVDVTINRLERELAEKTNEVARLRTQRNDLLYEMKASLAEVAASQAEVEKIKEENRKVESDTPRTEMMLSKPTPRDQIVDFARKMEREVARLREELKAENAKLHTENVCLQELLQEFYEWSRRDYPTEAEVREIMDRYYDLLNK